MTDDDLIRPFQIEGGGLRGRLVRLGPTADEIIRRHGYPPVLSELLGEALALTALLAGALKFDGAFSLQARGDGPVSMLLADYFSPGRMRGYLSYDADRLAELDLHGTGSATVPRLLGGGYLAFTVDQGDDTERYQGIVGMEGATLADCAHHYFRESEQIDSAIRLAAAPDPGGAWRAGGVMIQRLPEGDPAMLARGAETRPEDTEDDWRRAVTLLATAQSDELLSSDITPDQLLYRLYHEDGVRVFEPVPLSFGCTCSRQRADRVLRSLSDAALEDLIVDGRLDVTCEFCNAFYEFQPDDYLLRSATKADT